MEPHLTVDFQEECSSPGKWYQEYRKDLFQAQPPLSFTTVISATTSTPRLHWLLTPFPTTKYAMERIPPGSSSRQQWFKFSTTNIVCMHFCNQGRQYAKTSIMLDKNPIKVVTEAKFLGMVSGRTLSYKNHVNYL